MNFEYSKQKKFEKEKIYIDELEGFRKLLGFNVDIGKKFLSPFRNDRNPGCKINIYNHHLYYFDSNDPTISGKNLVNCWAIVNNCTTKEAYKQIINSQLSNSNYTSKPNYNLKVEKKELEPITRSWTKPYIDYWISLGVKDLTLIDPIEGYIINGSVTFLNCIGYVYWFEKRFKIYIPKSNNMSRSLFLGNALHTDCWYLKNYSNTLFITKSSKCYKVVESLIREFNLQIDLIHLQSEGINKDLSKLPNLHIYNQYERKISLFDNDSAGVKNSAIMRDLIGTEEKFISIDDGKDIADYYLKMGREKTLELLMEFIK